MKKLHVTGVHIRKESVDQLLTAYRGSKEKLEQQYGTYSVYPIVDDTSNRVIAYSPIVNDETAKMEIVTYNLFGAEVQVNVVNSEYVEVRNGKETINRIAKNLNYDRSNLEMVLESYINAAKLFQLLNNHMEEPLRGLTDEVKDLPLAQQANYAVFGKVYLDAYHGVNNPLSGKNQETTAIESGMMLFEEVMFRQKLDIKIKIMELLLKNVRLIKSGKSADGGYSALVSSAPYNPVPIVHDPTTINTATFSMPQQFDSEVQKSLNTFGGDVLKAQADAALGTKPKK